MFVINKFECQTVAGNIITLEVHTNGGKIVNFSQLRMRDLRAYFFVMVFSANKNANILYQIGVHELDLSFSTFQFCPRQFHYRISTLYFNLYYRTAYFTS